MRELKTIRRVKFDQIFNFTNKANITTTIPISLNGRTVASHITIDDGFISGMSLIEHKDNDILGYIENGIFVITKFPTDKDKEVKNTVQVVLLNKEGYVLGVSRKDNHEDFGLPGGKVEERDINNEEAAIREVKEETGLDIDNLQLIFLIHKNGFMGYTYLAEYSGEINYTEPHIVKWVPFDRLIAGSFGKYNQLVSESLDSMGIKYRKTALPKEPWMFSILEDEYHDYPIVIVAPLKYWEKHKVVPYPFTKKQAIDLYNLCENGNIDLAELDETSYEVHKDRKRLTTNESVIKAMTDAGFVYIKELE